jgi:uncharacterized membrane protein YeiH
MEQLYAIYSVLDLTGTFAFAISGAVAAKQRGLDLFGIAVIAFTVACGGGIIRDVCLGVVPPAGLSQWPYLVAAMTATALTIGLFTYVKKLNRPVLFFDAVGLSLFAVTGVQKSLALGFNGQVAVLLGITTAVGGGVLRDILLNRVPVILEREVYASAALLGSLIVVLGRYFPFISGDIASVIALLSCLTVRLLALRYQWNLPTYRDRNSRES